MSCSQFIQFLKKKCRKCFGIEDNESKNKVLEEKLVQLHETSINKPQQQQSFTQQKQKRFSKDKDAQMEQKDAYQKQALKEDKFYSIEQNNSDEEQTKRKSTKKIGRLDILQRSQTQKNNKQKSKSQLYASGEWEDTPVAENVNFWDEIQKVKDWFKKQYGKVKLASFRVNHAVRLRMQGNGMLTLLTHKLQDFKIKSTEETSPVLNQGLSNKSKTLTFQYLKDQTGQSSYKRIKILSYYEIKSYASLQQIIKALISREAMKILHDFKCIQPVQDQGRNLKIPFPILQVRQNVSKLKNDRVFHLASQMGESSDSRGEDRQIIFVIYSLDQSEQSWQCVIKIFFGFLSLIEIYCESCQDEKQSEQAYFQGKFTSLQKYLAELKIIPAT